MEEESKEYTKVYFEFFNDILEEDYVESVWAAIVNEKEGHYKLKNIPFFVKGYASEDTVYAELEEERLIVKGLVEESGSSTIQIICFKEENAGEIQKRLEELGCAWEGSHLPGYFSVDVSVDLDYEPIREYLSEQEKKEILGYREACLAH